MENRWKVKKGQGCYYLEHPTEDTAMFVNRALPSVKAIRRMLLEYHTDIDDMLAACDAAEKDEQ